MSHGPADATAFVLLVTIAAYSVAGGVDFGAGIWDLLAGNDQRGREARSVIDHAMAPVWEANNVWLVLAIVLVWTGFPLLFQSIFASLYPLYVIALLGIILRGAFFAFRHVAKDERFLRTASRVFGISSLLTPFFFAASLGAIASGRVGVGAPPVSVWEACVSPMSIAFGLVSFAATAFIGATFLVGDARRFEQPLMVEYFRNRVILATPLLIILGTGALVVIRQQAPTLFDHMLLGPGLPFVLGTVVLTPVVGLLVFRRVYRWYRVLAVFVVGSLVFAWAVAQSPYLLPGELTIAQAAAPSGAHVLLLIVTLAVIVLVLPSLGLLVYLDQRGRLESTQA